MKLKQVLFTVVISAITAIAVMWGYSKFINKDDRYAGQQSGAVPPNYSKQTGLFGDDNAPGMAVDFTAPSAAALPAVVHIKTKTNAKQVNNNLPRTRPQSPFGDFFGDDIIDQLFGNGGRGIVPEQRASGSGVIISDDGYIVTNNHVVNGADELTVTMNYKKTYKAKVVGTDPAYDLAVIKIEASGLPFLLYGNSDELKIGQWVLALGYPLNLETTVTAGIVSAKARSLGLNKGRNGDPSVGVESFIQTDAAVNQGNSGGALINTDGKLVGINSAIASPTGYYSGYSYAIPVNIVKKVVDDLIKFGTVQRGYLGLQFQSASDMDEETKKRNGIPVNAEGIYAADVPMDGGAYAAGIRKGDIIKKVDGVDINSSAELQGQVSKFKPGDKVPVTYLRAGKENTVSVTLKNKAGNYDLVKNDAVTELLGGSFETLDPKKAKEYGIEGGVIVKKINAGALNDQTRMKDGFVIIKINEKDIKNFNELKAAVGRNKNITISGFYPGYDGVYEYPITLGEQ